MSPGRRSAKADSTDISAKLAEALAQKSKPEEKLKPHDVPEVGDKVTIGSSDTIYAIIKVSHDGRKVDLNLPGTMFERYRVSVDDLNFIERSPRKPKEPPKPRVNLEEVREHITSVHHSMIEHMTGEVAALKKYLQKKGVSAGEALDKFSETTEEQWKVAVKAIEKTLDEE